MRLITGDECGLLKECIPELARRKEDDETAIAPKGAMPYVSVEGISRIDPREVQARSRGVADLAFACEDSNDEVCFAALRQNGTVEMWEGKRESKERFIEYDKAYSTHNLFKGTGTHKADPLMLGSLWKNSRLCAGNSLGHVHILNSDQGTVVQTYELYDSIKPGRSVKYTLGKEQIATAMACDVEKNRLAVGGRERDASLFDLETGKQLFKAKNIPPDPQTLLQYRIWPTAISFLDDSNILAVGTAYKELRLYDVREDSRVRRPTALTPEGLLEFRVTSLCQIQDYEVAVGDAAGYIQSVDLRSLGKNPKSTPTQFMGRFVGPAGSVRQLKKHPTLPRLAAIGLDRMLRIYDTNSKKQLDCVYLKQRLNCVLLGSDDTWTSNMGTEGDLDIDQEDEVHDYINSDDEAGESSNTNWNSAHTKDDTKEASDEYGDRDLGTSDEENVQDGASDDSTASNSEDKSTDSQELETDDSLDDADSLVRETKKRRRR